MATCQPPDVDLDSPVVDQPPPQPDNPAQPDVEDRNFNYVNDAEDPTNQLDADGNITSTPLELWELPTEGVTVTIPGQGGTMSTRKKDIRPSTVDVFSEPVQLTYYPYGNDEIAADTTVYPDQRTKNIGGVDYFWEFWNLKDGVPYQGYLLVGVLRGSNVGNQNGDYVWGICDPDTGDLIAVHDLKIKQELDRPIFPERHPWYPFSQIRVGSATADLGRLNQDPFADPALGSVLGNRAPGDGSDFGLFYGLWPGDEERLGVRTARDNRYLTVQTTPNGTRISWWGTCQYWANSPDYEGPTNLGRASNEQQGYETGNLYRWPESGLIVTTKFTRTTDTVFWVDLPADPTVSSTLELNWHYVDRRNLERAMYNNHNLPLGMVDRQGYGEEYFARTGSSVVPSPSNPSYHGIVGFNSLGYAAFISNAGRGDLDAAENGYETARIAWSPSGNRFAVTQAMFNLPNFFWYTKEDGKRKPVRNDLELPKQLKTNGRYMSVIVVYDYNPTPAEPGEEWTVSAVLPDPYWYSSDFGTIEADGSIRTYSGPANPVLRERCHPFIQFTDENTIRADYFSQTYWENIWPDDTIFYEDTYSLDATAGSGDFITGPTVLSSSSVPIERQLQSGKALPIDPFTHPISSYYANLSAANPGLLHGVGTGVGGRQYGISTSDAPLDDQMENRVVEYNGFKIISFPSAPLAPNISQLYAHYGQPTQVPVLQKRNKQRYGYSRRGFAGIGQVSAYDAQGNLVKNFEPPEAQAWVKFQDGENGGRIIGRPMAWGNDVNFPEDEVAGPEVGNEFRDPRKSVGGSPSFGHDLWLSGNYLFIRTLCYKGTLPVDSVDLNIESADTPEYYATREYWCTPADSDTLWEREGWYRIDLSTIPELNP